MTEQPCVKCPERRYYAMFYDMHFSGEDCPYECERYEKWKAERKVGSGNDILEQIRNTNPDNVASKVCDKWLNIMKDRYHIKIESMKNEIKQLEQEIEQEKIKVGTDEYNKRISSIFENSSAFH